VATVIVVTALMALGLGRDAHAATLTVVNTNDSGAGSLRQAIADAAPGDTIDFDAGLSGQTITLTTGELLISKNLTITGPAGGITVSGNNTSRVFDIGAVGVITVNISSLTIANGNTSEYGGGIRNVGMLTLTNSTVLANSAYIGGGIGNNGSLTLTDSEVSGNAASFDGGGIGTFGSNGTSVTLTNSTVSGNTATGVGVDVISLANNAVNQLAGDGGGIWTDTAYAVLTLTNSTISGNTANGGDIFHRQRHLQHRRPRRWHLQRRPRLDGDPDQQHS
jgi:hypothetical protein